MKMKNKGFLLFEVIISIVIITAGVLFVMRAYSAAKNSLKRSTELFGVSLLLEEKMWAYEESGQIEEGKEEGGFDRDFNYSWEIDAERLQESDINLVELKVFHKKHKDTVKYSIFTYLKNKEE